VTGPKADDCAAAALTELVLVNICGPEQALFE
jgi:hypothetical protein